MNARLFVLALGSLLALAGCTAPRSFSADLDSGTDPAPVEDGEEEEEAPARRSAGERDARVEDERSDSENVHVGFGLPDAGARAGLPSEGDVLADIDAYVLAHSIEQLASLELRRGGRAVWKRSREQIQQFVPLPGPFHLTELSFKKHWLDTFWAWIYQQSGSANADAERIARVLTRYFVGVQLVTVGPECRPAVTSYQRGQVAAGRPGDDTTTMLVAELKRSEEEVERLGAGAHCITGLQAALPAQQVAVTIDLPLDAALAVREEDIWAGDEPDKKRVGVPVPSALLYAGARSYPWSELPLSETAATLARIDHHILRQSLEQVAALEVRRGASTLFSRSYAEITPHLESTAPAPLTSLQYTRGWLDTFRTWLDGAPESADALRVARALSSYFIGVQAVSIGPACSPSSGGYVYGFVKPGVPGDGSPEMMREEIARSEETIRGAVISLPTTSCITALRPNPTGNVAPTHVIIELPDDSGSWVSDSQIWRGSADGERARAGVSAPEATLLRRGRQVY